METLIQCSGPPDGRTCSFLHEASARRSARRPASDALLQAEPSRPSGLMPLPSVEPVLLHLFMDPLTGRCSRGVLLVEHKAVAAPPSSSSSSSGRLVTPQSGKSST
ncbi:hypothetical protein EYF80_012045 [Liparis tanakae]|uniref:Uncharacterized protein n=1 Tax=Liparis tanakae TaxID=230148 RepID=A0A4Z2IIX7_9TELE|nr:hypothetical protein EYF80_012045 [Liparis tanakae]